MAATRPRFPSNEITIGDWENATAAVFQGAAAWPPSPNGKIVGEQVSIPDA